MRSVSLMLSGGICMLFCALPAGAQQMTSGAVQVPPPPTSTYYAPPQGQAGAYEPSPSPYAPGPAAQPAVQSPPAAQSQGYSGPDALSPYELQERAIQQSKFNQQAEDQKQISQLFNNQQEQNYQATVSKSARLKSAVGSMGQVLKRSVGIAAPVAGAYLLMRAVNQAAQPEYGYLMTPNGPMAVPLTRGGGFFGY